MKRTTVEEEQLLSLLLVGFPDRVCRRRSPGSPEGVMVHGRGVRLSNSSGVQQGALFIALRAEAGSRGPQAVAQVQLASRISETALETIYPELIHHDETMIFNEALQRVQLARRRCFVDLVLAEEVQPPEDLERASALLAEHARQRLAEVWTPDPPTLRLVQRLRFAVHHLPEEPWPDVSDHGLAELAATLCWGKLSFAELRTLRWDEELRRRLSPGQRTLLEREVPERLAVPSGRLLLLDYSAAHDGSTLPVLAVKLQEVFGWTETPRIACGRVPVVLHLLAPNNRPVQISQDLRNFWQETYHEVRKTLRGRYPKHPWPDDPWTAPPTARTKKQRP